ncbi:hypothetical protein Q5752_004254 [Cryptotrichosporon argae]
MSDGDRHPDLDDFYGATDDLNNEWVDEDDDEDDESFYLDPEDIAMQIEEEEYEISDEDGDDEDDDEDEDPPYTVQVDGDNDDDDDDIIVEDDQQQTTINLAALLSRTGGERAALLARLLSGPVSSSGGIAARLNRSAQMSDEERARRAAERRRAERWWAPQEEPHPKGRALLRSGEFGNVGCWERKGKKRVKLAADPLMRPVQSTSEPTLPNTPGTIVASYESVPYVGQYCGDYNIFYAATQYFTLHLYSTNQPKTPHVRHARRRAVSPNVATSPRSPGAEPVVQDDDGDSEYEDEDAFGGFTYSRPRYGGEDTSMKKIKTVKGVEGRWTVTDADADRSGEKMIYSSITPYVHMLYTSEHDTEHVEFDFTSQRRRGAHDYFDHFGIWSIRFSADGKEIVAGAGSGLIMVYDINAQRRTLAVEGHQDDVNAVCFADEASTNILVSGSDDGYVKVWDRRSLSSSTPSGVLVGATEGITYIAPKGDGRYVVANSKDQAARLYDLRNMRSWSDFENESDAVIKYGQARFDYRQMRYNRPARLAHPKDCSVMTYRGHSVLRTLIRCHFSPLESTGQNYIYSGSADGLIHIWSLDGRIVQVLNRAESAPLRSPTGGYTDPSAPDVPRAQRFGAGAYESYGMNWTVRDVAWHGREPTLMSTCWEVEGQYRHGGSLAKHEWKGLGKGGVQKLEDWVDRRRAEMAG